MGVKGRRNNNQNEIKIKRKRDDSKHKSLCERGAKWLKKHECNIRIPNCPLIFVDMKTIENEIPDILGFSTGFSVMIEVKVSRSDFLKDKNKQFRKDPYLGVGQMRLYLCNENIIKEDEIPDEWGLLYLDDNNKIEVIKFPEVQKANLIAERNMLLSYIRRNNN